MAEVAGKISRVLTDADLGLAMCSVLGPGGVLQDSFWISIRKAQKKNV